MNEIEKMAEIICEAYTPKQKPQELRYADVYRFKPTATALINAGYGDVKQAQREVLEELREIIYNRFTSVIAKAKADKQVESVNLIATLVAEIDIIDELLKEVCKEWID